MGNNIRPDQSGLLEQKCEHFLGKLVMMINHPDQWTIRSIREDEAEYA